MYKMVAGVHFERAIELASRVRSDKPLVPTWWGMPDEYELTMPVTPPTVDDLLGAIGADNFAGKSHHVLSGLHLQLGRLRQAEEHMDAANATGIATGHSFIELGKRYEATGQHTDAARAFLKAVGPEAGSVLPAKRALQNLHRALLDWR
jgi:hypothetical protein